ncbi:MAG: YkgJ family cysteine cluster protein [Planctomycetes bacterium]|jgi:Fe-S-cluster containining protein|nr:YkgJ family cysteine cluster protein [Planctomycetota bacterium]MCL4729836.1 YkgJ family cysteine cluster protein [Planctomycetota bacterium]
MNPWLTRLETLYRQADAEFARGARLHGPRIRCARGCCDCCGQVFRITEPEAARISLFVAALPEPEAARLRDAAQKYLKQRAALFGGAESWDSPLPVGARLPCPALTPDGACGIYEARPTICRKFGVPVFNPNQGSVTACELNFKPGDAIEDAGLVAAQTALFRAQQDLQAQWNAAGGARVEEPLCVASALARDLSGLLPPVA